MKNTKTNVIEFLKKRKEAAIENLNDSKRCGNEKLIGYYEGKLVSYNDAINLLNDEEYFKCFVNMYNK